jgi:hypothetical protein
MSIFSVTWPYYDPKGQDQIDKIGMKIFSSSMLRIQITEILTQQKWIFKDNNEEFFIHSNFTVQDKGNYCWYAESSRIYRRETSMATSSEAHTETEPSHVRTAYGNNFFLFICCFLQSTQDIERFSLLHIERYFKRRLKHTICNWSHKNIREESQKSDCTKNKQLIRDLFNQPEIGRRLNRMWPEDLVR